MTKEPRRLSQSGGASQRLLDSASLDVPSRAARQRAALLAATASSFANTTSGVSASAPASVVKTLGTWAFIGAAASVTLGLVGTKIFEASPAPRAAATLLTSPAPQVPASTSPDISPEPAPVRPSYVVTAPSVGPTPSSAARIEPWIPSPNAVTPNAASAAGVPRPSIASFEEAREIEAARASVSRGDAHGALAQLDDYDSTHPNGQLKPESMVLRIQALSSTGQASEARRLATEFQSKYPENPLVQRVNRAVSK